jgi:hypothetical protein
MKRWTAMMLIVVLVGLVAAGCGKKNEGGASGGAVSLSTAMNTVAGVKWQAPKRWGVQGPRDMRVATYNIPPAEGDAEQGECAVFYFGDNAGGTVDANIDRWIGQFEATGMPARSEKEVGGMKVTLVQIAGAYLSPSGPMMQSSGKKENYRLLGAIVQGPKGAVFFKCTGPAKTIASGENEFNAMVETLSK